MQPVACFPSLAMGAYSPTKTMKYSVLTLMTESGDKMCIYDVRDTLDEQVQELGILNGKLITTKGLAATPPPTGPTVHLFEHASQCYGVATDFTMEWTPNKVAYPFVEPNVPFMTLKQLEEVGEAKMYGQYAIVVFPAKSDPPTGTSPLTRIGYLNGHLSGKVRVAIWNAAHLSRTVLYDSAVVVCNASVDSK